MELQKKCLWSKMGLTYDDGVLIRQKHSVKSQAEKAIDSAGEFPNCKGLYPDCPEKPSLKEKACGICPKTDDLEKPLLKDD